MKSPSSYQNQFSHISRKRGQALDVFVSRKSAPVVAAVFRSARTLPVRPLTALKKHSLDGMHREKRALLAQLQEQSFQDILWRLVRKGELYSHRVKRVISHLVPSIAPRKMLYGSLVGGIAFGIVSMGFIEHFFGPGVFARGEDAGQVAGASTAVPDAAETPTEADTEQADTAYDSGSDIFFEYFNEAADEQYKEAARAMVKGYPIEEMLPYIFEQDRLTAAFLIGIAKKESNWGKRVPVLNDQDCFNYWGYRGIRRMMGTGGHTCFNSRKDAVETVAKRLSTLINSQQLNTPEKMIIWKCGFSCSGHSRESVRKWIADVDMYFKQLSNE
ncbi:MAG: hypothetical protein AAB547_01935 [Patescibacteria group bacterium]